MNVKLKMILISASIVLMLAASLGIIIIGRNDADYEERLEQAGVYLESRDYDNAIAIYNRIISENRSCAEAYVGLSEAYFAKDNADKALDVLEKGARNTGGDDTIMDKRAELFPALEYASASDDGIVDDFDDDGFDEEDEDEDRTVDVTSEINSSETEAAVTEVTEESITESETTVLTTEATTVPTTVATTAATTAAPVITTTAPPAVTVPPATTQETTRVTTTPTPTTVTTTTVTTTEALKDVSVTDFTKMSLDEAYEWCSKNNVILNVVGTENNSSRILSQSPAPKSVVKENSSVIVVLDE